MNELTLCSRTGLCVAVLHGMRSAERSTFIICILIVIQIHAYHSALASTSSTATGTLKETERGKNFNLFGFLLYSLPLLPFLTKLKSLV